MFLATFCQAENGNWTKSALGKGIQMWKKKSHYISEESCITWLLLHLIIRSICHIYIQQRSSCDHWHTLRSKERVQSDLSWVPGRPYMTWYSLLSEVNFFFSRLIKSDFRGHTKTWLSQQTVSQSVNAMIGSVRGRPRGFVQPGGQSSLSGFI